MTSKKAVKIVEMLLEKKISLRRGLTKPENKWPDMTGKIVHDLQTSLGREIDWLKLLKKEIAPPCKHPKKMHDMCGGQKYCMNCNMDL